MNLHRHRKEVASLQDSPLTIIPARAQLEERLRKKAVELGEEPDKFVTTTNEDKRNSLTFRYRMEADARMCDYAKGEDEDHLPQYRHKKFPPHVIFGRHYIFSACIKKLSM
jgi:hypothetical protein